MSYQRRRKPHSEEDSGQDSFLDIVANLVGILLILVIVVGARASNAVVQAAAAKSASEETAKPDIDVAGAKRDADNVEKDINLIAQRMQRQEIEIAYRRKERDKLLVVATAAEQKLQGTQSKLNEDQQRRLQLRQQLSEATYELDQIKGQQYFLDQEGKNTKVLDHLPTPMAKTVFGREVHFRLAEGNISYVPFDELVNQLKAQAPNKIWKLRETDRITETIGPERGYWLKYALARKERRIETRIGYQVQRSVELERFIIVPVSDGLGEPVENALVANSDFDLMLRDLDPDEVTVTIWAYPDSFEHFRSVKHALFKRGFATAGRPLPPGQPIGGSPNGSRSSAQ